MGSIYSDNLVVLDEYSPDFIYNFKFINVKLFKHLPNRYQSSSYDIDFKRVRIKDHHHHQKSSIV